MTKFHQNFYRPINEEKYIGKRIPYYRSSWEFKLMRFLDNHSDVIAWASESHRIPYVNPFTGKPTTYVPDFFVVYEDSKGNRKAELIEVKPRSQILANAKTVHDRAAGALNEAKWRMARQWCKSQGIGFRIITENDIFRNPKN